eukprot:3476838-Pleurochrysis_carterae.AAC.1
MCIRDSHGTAQSVLSASLHGNALASAQADGQGVPRQLHRAAAALPPLSPPGGASAPPPPHPCTTHAHTSAHAPSLRPLPSLQAAGRAAPA